MRFKIVKREEDTLELCGAAGYKIIGKHIATWLFVWMDETNELAAFHVLCHPPDPNRKLPNWDRFSRGLSAFRYVQFPTEALYSARTFYDAPGELPALRETLYRALVDAAGRHKDRRFSKVLHLRAVQEWISFIETTVRSGAETDGRLDVELPKLLDILIEDAENAIEHTTDGPVTPFVAVSRAIELAQAADSNGQAISNALYNALKRIGVNMDIEVDIPGT